VDVAAKWLCFGVFAGLCTSTSRASHFSRCYQITRTAFTCHRSLVTQVYNLCVVVCGINVADILKKCFSFLFFFFFFFFQILKFFNFSLHGTQTPLKANSKSAFPPTKKKKKKNYARDRIYESSTASRITLLGAFLPRNSSNCANPCSGSTSSPSIPIQPLCANVRTCCSNGVIRGLYASYHQSMRRRRATAG
jgi:hypothetical protein